MLHCIVVPDLIHRTLTIGSSSRNRRFLNVGIAKIDLVLARFTVLHCVISRLHGTHCLSEKSKSRDSKGLQIEVSPEGALDFKYEYSIL